MTPATDPAADLDALVALAESARAWLDRGPAAAHDGDRLGLVNAEVSQWSPRQQIDHAALATLSICGALDRILAGAPECVPPGRPGPNLEMILTTGFIPRGRAEAPEKMKPAPDVTHAATLAHLDALLARLRELAPRAAACAAAGLRYPHFALGPMTAPEWLRFARIHFDHHVALARDAADV